VSASTPVTVGTFDQNGGAANSIGSIKLQVKVGTAGVPDDSDLLMRGSVSDVRCTPFAVTCGNENQADGRDYIGQLEGSSTARITDLFNGTTIAGGSDPATTVDVPVSFPFSCAGTSSTAAGGLCAGNTSLNATIPGAIKEEMRMVFEFAQVLVRDGGPDGDVTTSPNTTFFTQGVFVP
jgi:hypothetical protein